MIVDHPIEQLLAFGTKFIVNTRGPVLHQRTHFAHFVAHLVPVADGDADIGKDFQNLLLQEPYMLCVGLLVDREANE